MIYLAQFIDIKNLHTYDVKFTTNSGTGSRELQLNGDQPVVIQTEADTLFDPIKTQSATIQIVSDGYLFDLYSTGYDVSVEIKKDNAVIFKGYVTPNIYQQDWNNISIITVQCISEIAALKYKDYNTIGSKRDIYTIYEILKHCLSSTNYNWINLIAKTALGIDNTSYRAILKNIYLDETNFFDDNEEQTPWKINAVIEEIMKIMNFSLVEDNGELFMINYTDGLDQSCFFSTYYLDDNSFEYENTNLNVTSIIPSMYYSSSNNLSLDETYSKIIVKANTYPYENVFESILDSDKWWLLDVYTKQLADIYNSMYVPSVKWSLTTDGNTTATSAYFLYFTSNTMAPNQYYVDANDNLQAWSSPHDYITSLLADPSAYQSEQTDPRYKVGVSLMKMASYDITKANLVSSLQWKDTIILYTGLNNFNGDFVSSSDWDDYKLRCLNYISDNFSTYTLANNFIPSNYLLKFESEQDVIVSNNSYLTINGSICINDIEYEGSAAEYSRNGNFKKPISYMLNDTSYGLDDDKREYYGFPILDVQLRVGNKICCSYVVTEGQDAYMTVNYKWCTPQEVTQNPDYEPYITIPVGTDTFSYFKFYDITNTCDWRLGLENGKGFAIPMKAEDNLSGKLSIYIVGPNVMAYVRYLETFNDFKKLPTTVPTYTVARNPGNIWGNGWATSWLTYNVSYHGTFPNTVLIQELAIDIKEVKYYSITDAATKKNSNNKKTDQQYENILNAGNVNDAKEIECKINTQDQSKFRSFSSLLKEVDDEYDYISKMTMDGTNWRIQENNVVQTMTEHYSQPKVIFECDLQGCDFTNYELLEHTGINNGVKMIVNKQTKNLRETDTELQLVQI